MPPEGIESQDLNIFSLVQKNKKGLVVCVNKWDLVEDKSQKVIDTYTTAIRERLAPFTDFPILFISALTKQRILKVLETAKDVYENRSAPCPDSQAERNHAADHRELSASCLEGKIYQDQIYYAASCRPGSFVCILL